MSIRKLFLEARIHPSVQEFKEFLVRGGIDIEGSPDYYLASGANGDVYKIKGKPRVIKVEYDWTKETYKIYEKIKNANNLEHVVEVFYNKLVGQTLVTVLEYLEPIDKSIMPETSWYVLLHMEDIYHSRNYGKINQYSVYRLVSERMKDNYPQGMIEEARKIFEQIMDEYKGGDDILMKILLYQLLEVWIYPDDKYLQVLENVRDNPELFRSVYEGILEFEQLGIKHGDVHLDNILKDPRTGNIKLIDPFSR